MPCAGVCVGASPMHADVPVCAGLTARCCRSCVRVRFPLLTAMDRHTPMDRYVYTVRASRSRLAGVPVGVGLQRKHRRVEHRLCRHVVHRMRRFRPGAHRGGLRAVGRRRMRGRCARRRRRCVRARVRAHVAMRISVYVDGSPVDTHLCSSAIELPLHPSLSMSNAHTRRPFPRSMYT